jgi:predicted alpha/beta-hydrolase family hydrolase
MLMVQGERNALGNEGKVATSKLSPANKTHGLPDCDHCHAPWKAAGGTEPLNRDERLGVCPMPGAATRRTGASAAI